MQTKNRVMAPVATQVVRIKSADAAGASAENRGVPRRAGR